MNFYFYRSLSSLPAEVARVTRLFQIIVSGPFVYWQVPKEIVDAENMKKNIVRTIRLPQNHDAARGVAAHLFGGGAHKLPHSSKPDVAQYDQVKPALFGHIDDDLGGKPQAH